MTQGDEGVQPGERTCPDCLRRWYSAALLTDADAPCPECGGQLETVTEPRDDDPRWPER